MPQIYIGGADGLADRSLHQWLILESALNARGCAVQRGSHLQIRIRFVIKSGRVWTGLREQIVLEKLVYGFGGRSLGIGSLLLRKCDVGLPQRASQSDAQGENYSSRGRHGQPVAQHELSGAVPHALRLGQNWLSAQIPFDILR